MMDRNCFSVSRKESECTRNAKLAAMVGACSSGDEEDGNGTGNSLLAEDLPDLAAIFCELDIYV